MHYHNMNFMMLAKFHKKKYIEDMYKNEVLTSLAFNNAGKSLEFNQEQLNRKWQYVEYPQNPNFNICSLYTIYAQLDSPIPEIDPRMVAENDSVLLIWDVSSFFKKLDRSLEQEGYEFSRKVMTYYDPEAFNGELSPHHKDEYYDFQKEYRIVAGPTDGEPVSISIPGLKEVSTVVESSKLETLRVKA